MLNELMKAALGSISNIANTYPAGNGINSVNVPSGAVFKNFFNNLMSSLNDPYLSYNSYSGTPQAGTSLGAVQAYTNVQGQFGMANKNLKSQAFAPGIISGIPNTGLVMPPPQLIPNPGFLGVNQFAAQSPLTGFAGQAGFTGGVPTTLPFGQPTMYPGSPLLYPQNGLGKLQTLILPIVGLFSLVKSLFSFGWLRRGMDNPVHVDKENTSFAGSERSITAFQNEEGSFDNYYPDEYENDKSSREGLSTF